ncbi:MAG: glycosyltransferase [Bacillales bacterium]|nr:glycosyltransferase [Bacillales bacterium]
MRIGIFSDTYTPFINGVSTSIVCLKKALEKKGHEVYVVTVNNEKMGYSYDEKERVMRIPALKAGIYDYRLSMIYSFKAKKKIKELNLDVIHSQTEFGIGTFARLVAMELDIPIVHTYHTLYEEYLNSLTKNKIKYMVNGFVEYLAEYYCDSSIGELIVPTAKTKEIFKKQYKFKREVHVIPNGIDLDKFSIENINKKELEKIKKQYGIKDTDFVIMYVGRLGPEKNITFLARAQKQIVKKHKNCKLVIVGEGPMKNELEKITSSIRENVIFTGKIPQSDIQYYYRLADVFATASKFETQGLTVIEALASGVCALCILDDSFKDALIDNVNGNFFETEKEYVDLVDKLMTDEKLLNKYKKNAIKTANEHSYLTFGDKVLEVYELAIKNNKEKTTRYMNRFKKTVKGVLKK